jgi:hypothetical protein
MPWKILSCFSHISYRKRMFIYFVLFIFYTIQLATYQSSINHNDNPDPIETQKYLVAINSLLLTTSIICLLYGWITRNGFERYYVVFNSFLFGLTFGWLILAAPSLPFHQGYYVCNILVCLMLIAVDVCAQLYVRPEVISIPSIKAASSSMKNSSVAVSSFFSSFWHGTSSGPSSSLSLPTNSNNNNLVSVVGDRTNGGGNSGNAPSSSKIKYGQIKERGNSIDDVEAQKGIASYLRPPSSTVIGAGRGGQGDRNSFSSVRSSSSSGEMIGGSGMEAGYDGDASGLPLPIGKSFVFAYAHCSDLFFVFFLFVCFLIVLLSLPLLPPLLSL